MITYIGIIIYDHLKNSTQLFLRQCYKKLIIDSLKRKRIIVRKISFCSKVKKNKVIDYCYQRIIL